MNELDRIKRLVDGYDDNTMKTIGAPFLFRTFTFLIKEFPQCFKKIKFSDSTQGFVLKDENKKRYKFTADKFSCGRYIVNESSKLLVECKNSWKLISFEDFSALFLAVNQQRHVGVQVIDVESQLDKLRQQTRYYVFISECANLARTKLKNLFETEDDFYQKIVLNHECKNLAFLLMDCFGVVDGHLDHPTPYPYSDSLSINLLGNDPFLSFLNIMDDIILLNDNKFSKCNIGIFSKDGIKKNINGLDLALLPRRMFEKDMHGGLSRLSLIYLKNVNTFFNKEFFYDEEKYFLLTLPKIERKLINASLERSHLLDDIIFLNYSLVGVSTSSGRSMIVPVSDGADGSILYIKTSWSDVIKTSLNRGLSLSKMQWFKICNKVYGNFQNKYFDYLTEVHYNPVDANDYHFAFIERDYKPILKRKEDEFVLPLIGLVVPRRHFYGDKNFISYLANKYGDEIFIRKLIKSMTDTLIFQLLDKGVFHGLHLQNCCILFSKHENNVFPEKVVVRDGDIRICKNYLELFSKEELVLINGLTKKKGKISSKSKFYKYFFHNIINENFGNIEQCLMENENFSSELYWRMVYECFVESISENIDTLKNEGRFDNIRAGIVDDFKRMIYGRSGYAANFFEMEYLGKSEDFIKVTNPFRYHKIT